jgi:hypothetical protein
VPLIQKGGESFADLIDAGMVMASDAAEAEGV